MRTTWTAWASLVLALFFSSQAFAQQPASPTRAAQPIRISADFTPITVASPEQQAAAVAAQEGQEPEAEGPPSQLLTAIQAQQYRRTLQTVFEARIRFELGEDPGDAIETAPAAGLGSPGAAIVLPDGLLGGPGLEVAEPAVATADPAIGAADPSAEGVPSTPAEIAAAEEAAAAAKEAAAAAEAEAKLAAELALESARDAARFEFWVMAGAWPELQSFFTDTAGKDAAAIYAHLLRQISSQDQVMLPAECLQLAAMSPAPLDDEQIELLVQLLKNAGTRGSLASVPALIDGHPQFLIEDEAGRRRGARLLTGLGLVDAIEAYLPDLSVDETRPHVLAQHARFHQHLASQAGNFGDRMVHLNRAFELLRLALNSEVAEASDREEVLAVVLALLPELPESEVAVWRETLFADGRGFGLTALSGVCKTMETFERSRTLARDRAPVVREAKAMGEILAALTPPDRAHLSSAALGMVGMRLAAEAEFSLGAVPNDYRYYQYTQNEGRLPTNIETSDLLPWMPSVEWMALIDPGLAERLMQIRVRLAAQARLPEDALQTVKLAGLQRPAFAQELAELFLSEWTTALESQRVVGLDQMNQGIFYVNGVRQVNPGSAPLTRAHQMRSLTKLSEVLRSFAELGLQPMSPEALVEGFAACHSSAEVYQVADIEGLLGPIEAMPASMATALADNMRRNLASRWASNPVQTAAGTKRNQAQMEAEIERGYVLAERILERASEQDPDGWLNVLIRGALMFDFAEFSHKRDPDLREYAPIRDSAFVSFQRAAQLYAAAAEEGGIAPTALPYTLWFSAALGASELGYLTANTRPDNDQVDLLRLELDRLDAIAKAGQLDLFAAWVASVNVPAVMKPRFLRHALRILEGHEHPAAAAAAARLRLYDELVQEVLLVAEVDGPPEVAPDQPFGVRLSLRYTAALEREAGGFAKYLQNQVYGPATGAQVDYRDRFEEQVREKLFEGFEVDGIHFHRPEVEDRAVGVHGWMEKPLAYVILRARDAAVDRIASLQLDMDFSDGQSTVLLPVTSSVVLLDARAAGPAARPYEKLEVEQVLDAREWKDQKLLLEVRARGRGVLPEMAALIPGLDAIDGFDVAEVESHPLNITELDAESTPIMPLTERSWTVHLSPAEAASAAFSFPAIALANVESSLKRYDDLDLVDADPTVALDASVLSGGGLPWWSWLILLGVVGAVAWMLRNRRDSMPEMVVALPLPGKLTALSALAYLRHLSEESRLRERPEWGEELASEVASLERQAFAAGGEQPSEAELRGVLQRWRDRAVA